MDPAKAVVATDLQAKAGKFPRFGFFLFLDHQKIPLVP